MRRRRIWSEFLPAEELGHPATRRLLKRFALQPIVALPTQVADVAMARALRACCDDGIAIGLWPLLDDANGYWPGADNAAAFARRAQAALAFADRAGVLVATLAIDLEPALALKRALLRGSLASRGARLWRAHREARSEVGRARWAQALRVYRRLAAQLRDRSIESLAIAVPPVVLDLENGVETWQAMFSVPVVRPGFATLSPMIYSSMIQQALPGKSESLARAVVYEAARRAGNGATAVCMSLGIVGPAASGSAGKLGDERCYADPAQLDADLGLARSAGLDDMALFSLEGVLARADPEAWLRVFAGPGRPVSTNLSEIAARSFLRCAGMTASAASRLLSGAHEPSPW